MKKKSTAVLPVLGLLAASATQAADFTVTSPELKAGGKMANEQVYNSFGCSGGNVSPALSWKGAPADTKSFAVTMYDPDAPTGSGWWHWVVFNIPATTTSLPKNASATHELPAGTVQSRTDFGTTGYGGPCPPPGRPHHYQFTVYALKIDRLPLDENASAAMVGFNLHQNMIKKTVLTANYGR